MVELEDERLGEEASHPSTLEPAGVWRQSRGARAWLSGAGVVASIAALTAVGSSVTGHWKTRAEKPHIERPVGAVAPLAAKATVPAGQTTGRLQISSQPSAARVLVDGQLRGMTPLTLDDLAVGAHTVVLENTAGSVSRVVTTTASDPVVLEELIFSGWIAVYSPFDVVASEGAQVFAFDDRHQIMLTPGPHELHLENRALGYEEVRHVNVKPGEVATLQVTPSRSALTVRATEDAQVWVDGEVAGDTPLVAFPVALGTHEVIVKRAGDERRVIVTSTVKPVDLTVDFSRPAP